MAAWYTDWHDGDDRRPCHNERIKAVLFSGISSRGDRTKPALLGLYDAENNQIRHALGTTDWDEVVFWRSAP